MHEVNDGQVHRRGILRLLAEMLAAIFLFVAAAALAIIVSSSLPALDRNTTAIVKATVTVALALAVYKFGIRRLSEDGSDDLPASRLLPDTAIGIVIGGALFGTIVCVAAILGVYRIISCCSTRNLVSDLCIAAIMPGFMEELFFRGILFRWIEKIGGSWIALFVTSVLFGLAHALNPNATAFSSIAIAVEAGVLLGGAYMLTRNLWLPIGLHAAWNFTQGFLFGIPVSGVAEEGMVGARLSGPELVTGGGFGLEASVIAFVLATTVGVLMVVLAAKRGRVARPLWMAPVEGPAAVTP